VELVPQAGTGGRDRAPSLTACDAAVVPVEKLGRGRGHGQVGCPYGSMRNWDPARPCFCGSPCLLRQRFRSARIQLRSLLQVAQCRPMVAEHFSPAAAAAPAPRGALRAGGGATSRFGRWSIRGQRSRLEVLAYHQWIRKHVAGN